MTASPSGTTTRRRVLPSTYGSTRRPPRRVQTLCERWIAGARLRQAAMSSRRATISALPKAIREPSHHPVASPTRAAFCGRGNTRAVVPCRQARQQCSSCASKAVRQAGPGSGAASCQPRLCVEDRATQRLQARAHWLSVGPRTVRPLAQAAHRSLSLGVWPRAAFRHARPTAGGRLRPQPALPRASRAGGLGLRAATPGTRRALRKCCAARRTGRFAARPARVATR